MELLEFSFMKLLNTKKVFNYDSPNNSEAKTKAQVELDGIKPTQRLKLFKYITIIILNYNSTNN